MRRIAVVIALSLLVPCGFLAAQDPAEEEDPLDALKKILKEMQYAEKLLAKVALEKGSEAARKIEEDLEKIQPKVDGSQEKAVEGLSKQLESVEKRMADIVTAIQKFVENMKFSEGPQKSEMEMPESGKPKESKGEQKKDGKKDDKLEKTGKQDGKKDDAGRGGKEETEKGGQAEQNYANKKPADKPEKPAGKSDGAGRWGTLPAKVFDDIIHPQDFPKPRKYEDLIQKYFEMLSKMSKNE